METNEEACLCLLLRKAITHEGELPWVKVLRAKNKPLPGDEVIGKILLLALEQCGLEKAVMYEWDSDVLGAPDEKLEQEFAVATPWKSFPIIIERTGAPKITVGVDVRWGPHRDPEMGKPCHILEKEKRAPN